MLKYSSNIDVLEELEFKELSRYEAKTVLRRYVKDLRN